MNVNEVGLVVFAFSYVLAFSGGYFFSLVNRRKIILADDALKERLQRRINQLHSEIMDLHTQIASVQGQLIQQSALVETVETYKANLKLFSDKLDRIRLELQQKETIIDTLRKQLAKCNER